MTTTAAKVTEHSAEKEKTEKRRALGRGLDSLLPGPRVVPPAQSSGAVSQQQVPFDSAQGRPHRPSPVRNDNAAESATAAGERLEGTIQAVVDQAEETQVPRSARNENVEVTDAVAAELHSTARAGVPSTTARDGSAPEEPITILAQAESRVPSNLVINLAIADVDKNPFQTRYVDKDDALQELADSIKVNGVVQPIVVRPAEEEGRYVLILGERRLHASKLAGKDTIPAMVRRVSAQQAAEMTIIENLQREDLSPLEQAEAFRVLSEEFKLTQAEIGERVGLSRVSVANYMRLLRLPREVMQLLAEKRISFAEARELLKLDNNDKIKEAALYAVKKGMTLEQIEQLVMRMEGFLEAIPGMPGQEKKKSGARWVDPNVRAAQTELERLLAVRVRIRDRRGKGKIVIEYSTVDDYERVVGMLRGKG